MQSWNYKAIAYCMQGCTLETALRQKIKKVINIFLIISIGTMLTLGTISLTKWLTFESVHQQGMTDAMRAKNGQKQKISYAGAAGEGRIKKEMKANYQKPRKIIQKNRR